MIDAAEYVKETVKKIRTTEVNLGKRKAKAKPGMAGSQLSFDPSKTKLLRIFVANEFPTWQGRCVEILSKNVDKSTCAVDEKSLRSDLEKEGLFKDKRTMPFIMMLKTKIKSLGISALQRALTFDERD